MKIINTSLASQLQHQQAQDLTKEEEDAMDKLNDDLEED